MLPNFETQAVEHLTGYSVAASQVVVDVHCHVLHRRVHCGTLRCKRASLIPVSGGPTLVGDDHLLGGPPMDERWLLHFLRRNALDEDDRVSGVTCVEHS
jgi:hypothetical protein